MINSILIIFDENRIVPLKGQRSYFFNFLGRLSKLDQNIIRLAMLLDFSGPKSPEIGKNQSSPVFRNGYLISRTAYKDSKIEYPVSRMMVLVRLLFC